MSKPQVYIKIGVNLLIAIAGILFVWLAVPRLLIFFMPFVIGWIISVIAWPLVRFLDRKVKIVPKFSSAIIIIAVLALVITVIYILAAKIGAEISDFIGNMPELYTSLEADFREIGERLQGIYNRLPAGVQDSIDESGSNLSVYVGDIAGNIGRPTMEAAGRLAMNIPSMLLYTIVTLVSAYFFIADREKIYGSLKKYTPEPVQKNTKLVADKSRQILGGYFKAQFKIMVVVAVIIFAGLLILGVDYLLLLTLLIAVLDFLPVFGSGTILLPWMLFEILTGDYRLAVGLLILYGITQLVRQLIQPKLVGDSIGLNPFLTLFFLFVGFRIGGVPGMILGIPVGMILIALYEMGAFDNWIRYVKIIVRDINNFRRIDEEE